MPTPELKTGPPNTSINPEADRTLKRIAITYGALVVVLLVVETLVSGYVNALLRSGSQHGGRKTFLELLNGASILLVLIPFYGGIYKLFSARLAIGRERVQARAWREGVAALEPFSLGLQRFIMDQSGEAHYWLAQAYTGLGDKSRAEAAREFVRRRKGVWAEKLMPGKPVLNRGASGKAVGKGASVYAAPGQENRPRPPKGKPKRRF